jgi:hypothetical protein
VLTLSRDMKIGLGDRLADNLELPQHSKGEHINTRAILLHPTLSPATRPSLPPHTTRLRPFKDTHLHTLFNHG